MVGDYYTKNKGISFQEIIWKTLESLREKTALEFRTPEKKQIIHSSWTETILEGDSRKEFCQLVEFLSDILIQEFKGKPLEDYNEIVKAVKDERNKLNKKEIDKEDFIVFKVDKMRELLRLIMTELKEKQYLKGLGSTSVEEYQE